MVEIIGHNKEIMKTVTCKECGAILRYGKHDIQTYRGHDYSGGSDGRDYISCAGCPNTITLRAW